MKKNDNIRYLAFESLMAIENGHIGSKAMLHICFKSVPTTRDRDLLQTIVLGVLRFRNQLDWQILKIVNHPQRLQSEVLQILRIGFFQFLYLERIPVYAIVNEAVQTAHEKVNAGASGLINAVLRHLTKIDRKQNMNSLDENSIEELSILSAHPQWLLRRWRENVPESYFSSILQTNNSVPPVFLRLTKDKKFSNNISSGKISPISEITGAFRAFKLPNSLKSLITSRSDFFIQDINSQWAIQQVELQGQILEACSGRGGKTLSLIGNKAKSKSNPEFQLWTVDLQHSKLIELNNRVKRHFPDLNLDVNTCCLNLLQRQPLFENHFNSVFLDAPCSNLGVIRRHPELKWRIDETYLNRQVRQQKRLLKVISSYVSIDGFLLYAVCSFEPEEGVQQIQSFLEEHSNFEPVPFTEEPYKGANYVFSSEGFVTFYPSEYSGDGFFVAKLRKTN